jgi:hypothetical protein
MTMPLRPQWRPCQDFGDQKLIPYSLAQNSFSNYF